MNPLDNTPKDGDFAAYVESLVDGRIHLPGGAPAPRGAPVIGQSAAAHPVSPPAASPGARGSWLPGALSASGWGAGARGPAPSSPQPAPGAPLANAGQANGHNAAHGGANSAGQMPAASPTGELLDLVRPHLGTLTRVLAGVAVVWFLIGAVFDLSPFAETIPLAMLMLFAAAWLHNQKKP